MKTIDESCLTYGLTEYIVFCMCIVNIKQVFHNDVIMQFFDDSGLTNLTEGLCHLGDFT